MLSEWPRLIPPWNHISTSLWALRGRPSQYENLHRFKRQKFVWRRMGTQPEGWSVSGNDDRETKGGFGGGGVTTLWSCCPEVVGWSMLTSLPEVPCCMVHFEKSQRAVWCHSKGVACATPVTLLWRGSHCLCMRREE